MGHRVIKHASHGYRHLDPIPDNAELASFYEDDYYRLIREGGRAHGLARLLQGGDEADQERTWIKRTLHADIIAVLKELTPKARVLDVGCGVGDFMSSLEEEGLESVGVEPSAGASEIAVSRGLVVHNTLFAEFAGRVRASSEPGFDALTLINVLEHVPDPQQVITDARDCLVEGGVLCIVVPNDFSELQQAACDAFDLDEWWVIAPDHINYFDFASLRNLLSVCDFTVERVHGDFPMELFLLMGYDYVRNPELGFACHQRRVTMELSLPTTLRREMYRSLASVGISRCCVMFGRRAV